MDREGLDVAFLREDGSLRLKVDHRLGIVLRPVSCGRLALLATIADLADWPSAQTEARLLTLLGLAAGLVRQHASGLVIDERRQWLQLQQVLPQDADAGELDQALEDFLNVLEFWARACDEVSQRPAGWPGGWR
jgi:hypothetical protein